MASKLPKFGEWEGSGGENITVRFDNAAAQKKKKANGQMINPNDPQENPDMFPQKSGPSSKTADPKGKRGGIPQFGAWENGDNVGSYTAVFNNVQKPKNGSPTVLPNEPQMNRNIQAQARSQQKPAKVENQQQEQRSKVPTFGGWENGDNVGYTAAFEKVQKMKNGQPTVVPNEPQMNRDVHPTARSQQKPAKVEHQQQEQRSKVPTFGSWDGGEGEFGYTECFDNVRNKTNKNGPTVTPEPSNVVPVEEGRPKVPPFGGWEEGDNGGAYTAYFENARKKKNAEPVLDPVEPQLNRDVNNRARPSGGGTKNKGDDHHLRNGSKGSNASVGSSFESASKYGKQTPGGQPPSNQKGGRLQQKTPNRGSQTPERGAAVPAWGGWRNDPSQAEGYTGAFKRAKEERNTPTHSNVPPRNNHHQPQSPPEPKKGCCFGWF